MKDDANLTDRVGQLEFQLAHLQRDYDQLNEVVTDQSNRIEQLNRQIANLESGLTEIKQAAETDVNLFDEKPPHY